MRCILLLLIFSTGYAMAVEISGKVELLADGKPLRAEEATDAVVYFRPTSPPSVKPSAKPHIMSMLRKQFVPRVLPITVGSQVRFPNQDPIVHNAFSTSTSNPFDVGLYGQKDGETITLSHAGYVRVYCNVHHSMVGHILVLDTPFFTRPATDGTFRLTDVPAVSGDLVVWHDRATPWRVRITAGKAEAQNVSLELNQRHIPSHTNKFGKPYGRSAENNGY